MVMFTAPKGVPEYFPPRSTEFLAVREALSFPARQAGYDYVELAIFEDTGLFVRGVGESTDVVSKEMYTFTDRGDRSLSLRPEGTAGVMRMVVEQRLDKGSLPVKVWYAGPFFRAERPQHGRYRQLQQVGIEAIGVDDPALDAEVIALADEAYRRLGLTKYELLLTSLGCNECRPSYRERLSAFLGTLALDEATRDRALLNPLRVLDDKRADVQSLLVEAPLMVDNLCASCIEHYDLTRDFLRAEGVQWKEAPRLVRGLDYYTKTTFEFSHPMLGAQSGIGGGGRYDGLMESIGGDALSGIGFGLGTDRTLLACEAEGIVVVAEPRIDIFAIPIGVPAKLRVATILAGLRNTGVRSDMAFGDRTMKGAMKIADRSGAPLVVIIGEDEMATDQLTVKNMATGVQTSIPHQDAIDSLRAMVMATSAERQHRS